MKRRGFSLPEVLVAVVLLGLIGGALTRLVIGQMRFFDTITAGRGARSVARESMNLILTDLRMVQTNGGVDSVGPTLKYLRVRVPYEFGVFCGTVGGVTTVSMLPLDSASNAFAKYAGYGLRASDGSYAINNTATAPTAATDATVCTTTAGIKTVSLNGRTGSVLNITPAIAATTTTGSAVFFFQKIAYYFATSTLFPGKIGLWRSASGGVTEELMAPFDTSAGFKIYTSTDDQSTTTVPASLNSIRGVDLILTAVSARIPAGRTTSSQSKMVTSVFFKNKATP